MTLRSSFDELEQVVDATESFFAPHTADEDLLYQLVLLTSEAVTNAIEHGNGLDESKEVYLVLEVADASYSIRVRDEGEGFDPGAVQDPLLRENLLSEGGRGLFLIEQMADEVEYLHGGREVCIRLFRVDG